MIVICDGCSGGGKHTSSDAFVNGTLCDKCQGSGRLLKRSFDLEIPYHGFTHDRHPVTDFGIHIENLIYEFEHKSKQEV